MVTCWEDYWVVTGNSNDFFKGIGTYITRPYLREFSKTCLKKMVLFKENVENHLCLVLREYIADKLQD